MGIYASTFKGFQAFRFFNSLRHPPPPPPPQQKPKNDILGANFAENGTLTEYTKTIWISNPFTIWIL